MIVSTTDFTGLWKVSQNVYSELSKYILEYEPMYMKKLLGGGLYDLYLATPTDARFVAIEEPFVIDATEDINCECNNNQFISDGFKKMLLGFIYFEYVNDQQTQNTTTGNVSKLNENSVNSDNQKSIVILRYNKAIDSYLAIQKKIKDNAIDYPEFAGVALRQIVMGGIL